MSPLADLFAAITAAREKALMKDQGPWPKNQPTASDLSACARETSLAILHWQERPGFTPEVLGRLEAGRDAEPRILPKLTAYGFEVVEQQRQFELKGKSGAVILRGRIDGLMAWQGQRIPFDLKTISPMIYPRMNTVEDLLAHPFFSKWPRQLWAYEYLTNSETGFLLLEDLQGHWKMIDIPMDWGRMETILQQCDDAVEAVEAVQRHGTAEAEALPPFASDPATCRRCWAFGRLCTPPLEYQGLTVADDPEMEAKLARRAELEGPAKEHETLDKEIKERVKGKDGLVIGPWLIQGKEITRNMKATEAKSVTFWQAKITRVSEESVGAA